MGKRIPCAWFFLGWKFRNKRLWQCCTMWTACLPLPWQSWVRDWRQILTPPRPGCAVPTEKAGSSSRATQYGLGSLGFMSSVELYNTILGFQGGNEVTRVYSGLSYPHPLAKNTSLFLVAMSSFLMMMSLGRQTSLVPAQRYRDYKGKEYIARTEA